MGGGESEVAGRALNLLQEASTVLVDALTYRAVTAEIQAELAGARVDRVTAPARDSVLITAGRGGKHGLLISASPTSARISLVTEAPGALSEPTPFVMLLRKHLDGGRILGIEQLGLDRVFRIRLEGWADRSEEDAKSLVVEIMGRGSNAFLVGASGRVIDVLRRQVRRDMGPGATYEPPQPQDRPEPWTIARYEQFEATLLRVASMRQARGLDARVDQVLSAAVAGVGPALAAEVCASADVPAGAGVSEFDGADLQRLWEAFSAFAADARRGRFLHEAAFDGSKPVACSSWGISRMAAARGLSVRRFDSACSMLEACFGAAEAIETLTVRRSALRRNVSTRLERVRRRIEAQLADADRASDDLRLKRFGDLLTANLHSLGGGPLRQSRVTVLDYYDPDMPGVVIEVDPLLSAVENAQRFYRQYSRAARAQEAIAENVARARDEESYLESVLEMVDSADDLDDIDAIRNELEILGYLRPEPNGTNRARGRRGGRPAAAESTSLGPTRFATKDGYDVLVGRNNLQNDELTFRIARGHDLWFHVKGSPGSHVVLRKSARETVPDEAMMAAAMLAAYYSRERHSSNVAVDCTEVRNVRKPKGAAPGRVIYDSHRTLYVTPSKEGLMSYLG